MSRHAPKSVTGGSRKRAARTVKRVATHTSKPERSGMSRFAPDATYIAIADLAKDTGWSEFTIRKWARNRMLTGVEKWGRNYRFRRGEVRYLGTTQAPVVRADAAMAELEGWKPGGG